MSQRAAVLLLNTTEQPDGCLMWDGPTNEKGFPRTKWHGRSVGVHRLLYTLTRDTALLPSEQVGRSCGQRACINPDHLVVSVL